MSLLDAMLLDPAKRPTDIWIALRTDSSKGSGTAEDPYHGGVILERTMEISLTHDGSTAEAATTTPHNYDRGDLITISGAMVGGVVSSDYNGIFVIQQADATTFEYEMKSDPGADADTTPAPQAQRNILWFDQWMQTFHAAGLTHLAIHLGPGEFLTRGNGASGESAYAQIGWRIREGWKIKGSGMDVTTLKMVGALEIDIGAYHIIGAKEFDLLADHAEVSDLTAHCNLTGTENGAGVTIAAVRLVGNHVRVRRVRAIEFGSWQPRPQGGSGPECFVISVGGRGANLPEPRDGRIEECVVEHRAKLPDRGPNELDNATCLNISSGEESGDGVMEHPRGCVIRNNYVDGAYADGTVALKHAVWGCGASGVGAIVERNRFFNLRTGGPYHDTWTNLNVVVRKNHYRNVITGVFENLNGISTTSKGIRIKELTYEEVGGQHIAHVTTFKEHGFVVPNFFRILNLDSATDVLADDNKYYYIDFITDPNGPTYRFSVMAVTGGFTFDYLMNAAPEDSILVSPSVSVEGHEPVYATALRNEFDARRLLASLSYDSGTGLVTATIANNEATNGVAFQRHDLKAGDLVAIIHAADGYNGLFRISEAPDNLTFKYPLSSAPTASTSPSGYYGRRWQAKKIIVENNLFELAPKGQDPSTPIAVNISQAQGSVLPYYVFPLVLVRNNHISHVDGATIPGDSGSAVQLQSVGCAIIENNRIQLDRDDSIRHEFSLNVRCFNNRDGSGALLRALKVETSQYSKEVADVIEDASLLAL